MAAAHTCSSGNGTGNQISLYKCGTVPYCGVCTFVRYGNGTSNRNSLYKYGYRTLESAHSSDNWEHFIRLTCCYFIVLLVGIVPHMVGTVSVDNLRRTLSEGVFLTSVCIMGERMVVLKMSVLSAMNVASGCLEVTEEGLWGGPGAAFLGRIPSFSFSLSGNRALNEVYAIFSPPTFCNRVSEIRDNIKLFTLDSDHFFTWHYKGSKQIYFPFYNIITESTWYCKLKIRRYSRIAKKNDALFSALHTIQQNIHSIRRIK